MLHAWTVEEAARFVGVPYRVAQQSGAALEAAQRALQTQQEAFSQVTAERDALAAAVGALRRQVEELQARAKRPWWAIWRFGR